MKSSILSIVYSTALLISLWISVHGFGFYLSRIIGRKLSDAKAFMTLTWYGLLLLPSLLFLLNLVMPIDGIVSIIVLVLGFGGTFLSMRDYRKGVAEIRLFRIVIVISITILVSTILTVGYPLRHDLGLYHFQAVRLINVYPAIRGLTNIHTRLGNVSSIYNLVALSSYFPWGLRAPIFNLIVALVMTQYLSYHSVNVFSQHAQGKLHTTVYSAVSMIFLVVFWQYFRICIDIVAMIIGLQIGYYLFLAVVDVDRTSLTDIILLSVAGVMAKLSLAVFSFVAIIFGLVVYIRRNRLTKTLIVSAIIAFFALIPFILHHYIKTGMLLFPLTWTDVGAEWGNIQAGINNRVDVTGWARSSGEGYRDAIGNFGWISDWLERNWMFFRPFIVVFLPTLGIWIAALSSANNPRSALKRSLTNMAFLAIPLVPSLVYWFFVTPSVRFSTALFLLPSLHLLALSVKETQQNIEISPIRIRRWSKVFIVVLITYSVLFNINVLREPRHPKMPRSSLTMKTTVTGMTYFLPQNTRQVWDTELFPNTPYRIDDVGLLGDTIKDGFISHSD